MAAGWATETSIHELVTKAALEIRVIETKIWGKEGLKVGKKAFQRINYCERASSLSLCFSFCYLFHL